MKIRKMGRVYIEMNKWLIAAMHAGISRVSFIMSSLSVKRSISGRGIILKNLWGYKMLELTW